MSSENIIICINRNENFAHQRKLQIGKQYLLKDIPNENTYGIYDSTIGYCFFDKENFLDIASYRDEKIEKLLS